MSVTLCVCNFDRVAMAWCVGKKENRLDCVRFLVEEPELFDLCFVVISRCYCCARVDVCCLMYVTLSLY